MKLLKKFSVNRRPLLIIAVLSIIIGSLFARFPGFYLPHVGNDEIQYLALAMKLDYNGFREYNLRGVTLVESEDSHFLNLSLIREGANDTLLKRLPRYYDVPLFHKPPLFIYALVMSHKMFASNKPYRAVYVNLTHRIEFKQLMFFLREQFYCVLVPLLFSLLLILATFFYGKLLFSNKTGIYSAILLGISPIDLLSSQKVWGDDMLAFFVTAAFILYYISGKKQNLVYAFLSGLCAGLAALTKPSGNIVIAVVLAYELWRQKVFSRIFALFLLTSVLVTLPWHWQILKTYGSLFYLPMSTQPDLITQYRWFRFVLQRPWYMYLVNVSVQTPLLSFVYPAILSIFKRCHNEQARQERDKKIFLCVWIAMFLIFFLIIKVGRELRYILPAYPAIAILSANALEILQKKINDKLGRHFGSLIIIAMIVICCVWSVSIGLAFVFKEYAEIDFPL